MIAKSTATNPEPSTRAVSSKVRPLILQSSRAWPRCLECLTEPLPEAKRGSKRRFCSDKCSKIFNNRRMVRGAILYDLFRINRRERDKAKQSGIWNAMCRLELSWNDEDAGRKTWKPAEMALADIEALDRRPTTNLWIKEPRP